MESVGVTAFPSADVMREAECSERRSSGRLPPHVVGRARPHGTAVRGGRVDADLGVTGELPRHSLSSNPSETMRAPSRKEARI